MSWETVGSHAAAFLAGTLAKVLAEEFTDRSRARRQDASAKRRFGQVEVAMPAFLQELRQDLSTDSLVREFVTLPSRGNVFNHGDATRFQYYGESHESLSSKVALLQNLGYIQEIKSANLPIWRMSEEFVQRLMRV